MACARRPTLNHVSVVWSGDSGGSASMEERPCTPGCGMISEIGPDSTGGGSGHVNESGGGASIGCALGDGDKARGGDAGHSVTLNSDTTMRRSLLNLEDAIAFNLAYKEENNTPPYNRLPVLALRLGSGLAASALPCAALTHGSALWQVLGAGSTAEVNYGSRLGPADGKVNLRALKRQRIDNNGGNTLSQNFAFVLDRCWNCGSYGHELQDCIHPRKHAVSDVCRRESSLVARRTARQAVAVQRRGPRKASYRRYFSTSTAEEEQEAAEATADASVGVGTVAEYYGKGGGQKRAPPGIRPGVLSAALALALNLSCPLDPPPWLIGMAVHGLPPAYCRGPYIPGVPEPLATDPLSVESCATVAWEGTCSQALCGAPVAAAMVAAAEGCSPDGTEGGEVAVQAVELLHFNPDRAAGDGVEGLPPKTTDVGCPKGSAFPDTQNTSAPTKWVADQPDIIAAVKGSSWGRTGRYNVDDASERLVSGSIAALSGFSPDSEGSEGTRSSSAFAVGQQASAGLRTAAATVAGTAGIASEHGFGGSEGACEEIGPAMEETALERRCGRSDIGARGTESVSFPDGMEPATLLQHSAINAALTIAEQPACAVAIDAAVGVQGIEQELDMDIDMGTDEDTVSLDAAAAGGVAAGSTGSEPDADADAETALLLQPLLPAAPRHVLFAGLNASIPQGACREHWQRALISARQVIACVAVVGGWGRRHEEPQLASTWAAKVTGGGQGPSGAAVDAAPEQVEVVAQAKAVDVPQEQPQQQTWQQESFPQVRQSQPHWQSSMPTQDELQRQAWWHQHKPQLAGNNFVMQQHIMMLKQQQQQHPCLATAFPVFFGVPTFQGFY
ncbi:hypothetical protein Vretimale_9621 [Volvox reticuliferus]|uniref:Uncharacterized protein n=1 Tax=Volvox reticuliferus TaxID=1737510 RepID=A0A8J4FYB1_9CHLO|nr:hypothetical protein Vretifemale_19228 [Volvox reticuliferus]GIM05172.1 hypothetical protein Vretimale_9621 [Volvox reticuliferus]